MPIPKVSAPHLRAKGSVPQIFWTTLLALVPAVLVFLFLKGFSSFRILTVSTASALLSEMGAEKFLGKRPSLYNGSALLSAFLFALFIPPDLASWKAALGAAFGIIFGKQIFGGLGQNPFNPSLVGCAFIFTLSSHPSVFFRESAGAAQSTVLAGMIFAGGLVLIFKRIIRWEVPLLYWGGYVLFCFALGDEAGQSVFSWPLLAAAFFIVTDPVTTPVTRLGGQWFALGAGIGSAFFSKSTNLFQGITSAVLLMNALSPWLDTQFRPAGAKRIRG